MADSIAIDTTTQTKQKSSESLSLWRKIGYGMGDIYGGGQSIIISFYYMLFLTDVVRLNPALAGTVILISKFYDSITDPFEGVLSDRTRTKMGRRRPYLLVGIPLIFISFFALFYPISWEKESARFAFVILTYLFFSTVVSIVMLNYNALQSELTLDYDERTSLSSVRIFFSTFASILCALIPLEVVKMVPDIRQGWIMMGIFFGLFFALPFLATFFSAQEREDFQKPPRPFNFKEVIIEPFKNRTFVLAMLLYVFAFLAIDILSSILIYFMKYYIGRGMEANYVAGTLLVTQVVSVPFFAWLSKRTTKRFAFLVACGGWAVVMLASFLLGPANPNFVVYLFAMFTGLATGGIVVISYAIFPDIPDVDELQSGERREGMFSSLRTLIRKISSAFALFLVGNLLSVAGYIAPLETIVDGVTTLVDQPQSDTFILALRFIFGILPILMVILAAVFAYKYPLSGEVHQRLNKVLQIRRNEESEDEAFQEEVRSLKKLLIG